MRWFSGIRAHLDHIPARESTASRVGDEKLRGRRVLAWLDGISLDFRLGGRMLVKHPGLTIVGGVAMAFAIWVGSIIFEMVMPLVHPTLPLPGGDRIVQLRNWDAAAGDVDPRALHDFVAWR